MQIKTFVNNAFRESCHIVSHFSDSQPHAAIIIDCGAHISAEFDRIRTYLTQEELNPVAHLLTHAHIDHVLGLKYVMDEYLLRPYLHPDDAPIFASSYEQAAMFGIPLLNDMTTEFIPLPPFVQGIHGEQTTLHIAGYDIVVLHTPGHSPGSVCYLFQPNCSNNTDAQSQPAILFSGDTLFQQGYGRTDLQGGDYGQLMASLGRLAQLPNNTIVYPGHGYYTTIADEF
ncbi:MAG: MBL fold metallo-hydrolase [Paludibacteraceae bacterium]|nr:MBL fold metallo-hydrolase [Paludibacteraceae bacterium]